MNINLGRLLTERCNANSASIDTLSTLDILAVINQEDQQVAQTITPYLSQIVEVIGKIATTLQAGDRLVHTGANTSRRLGIFDASECPPTFGTRPEQVMGIVVGGHKAILGTAENVEDSKAQGAVDLQNLNFSRRDVLAGPAASGRTPYVIGAMEYAHSQDVFVTVVSRNPHDEIAQLADVVITPVVGPEMVTGSTHLKAGAAQRLVLNMISTGAMIRVDKVYDSLMVDAEATNAKLVRHQVSIVMEAADCDRPAARKALEACGRHCKTAIVMALMDLGTETAQSLLTKNDGYIRKALSNT